jgi:hypothetical protein
MDYHAQNIIEYDVLRMPKNGYAFKEIVAKWPEFTNEPRNVRISLETNSVNPFGELWFVYSVWPIFVINNNIPPWMSIKRDHIMFFFYRN